jgi:hypothetical protein
MGDRGEQRLPEDLADVARLLREGRHQPTPLELDEIKTRAMAKAQRRSASRPKKGLAVRGRVMTLLLTVLVIGGTTAGGIAGSGGSSNGESAAQSQYKPPKCTRDMRKCECPKGYSLTVKDGQIVCSKNPPEQCDDNHGHGHGNGNGDDCEDNGHGGHGHHHHHHWRQGHGGHWEWCDGNENNSHDWHDWNGRDEDW